jgi:hypothetical protein
MIDFFHENGEGWQRDITCRVECILRSSSYQARAACLSTFVTNWTLYLW